MQGPTHMDAGAYSMGWGPRLLIHHGDVWGARTNAWGSQGPAICYPCGVLLEHRAALYHYSPSSCTSPRNTLFWHVWLCLPSFPMPQQSLICPCMQGHCYNGNSYAGWCAHARRICKFHVVNPTQVKLPTHGLVPEAPFAPPPQLGLHAMAVHTWHVECYVLSILLRAQSHSQSSWACLWVKPVKIYENRHAMSRPFRRNSRNTDIFSSWDP